MMAKVKKCPNCGETVKVCACIRNKCIDCGKSVGNVTFTVCDDCWDKSYARRKGSCAAKPKLKNPVTLDSAIPPNEETLAGIWKDFIQRWGITKVSESQMFVMAFHEALDEMKRINR